MCAIIDANVSPEVFGDDRTPRGKILYTWLTRLEKDFKNRSLIPDPRGKIYKAPDHRQLLNQHDLCPSRSPDIVGRA